MKFKRPTDYESKQEPFKAEELAAHTAIVLALRCIFCKNPADVLHKGTSYCQKCYDDKNYVNTLIA